MSVVEETDTSGIHHWKFSVAVKDKWPKYSDHWILFRGFNKLNYQAMSSMSI